MAYVTHSHEVLSTLGSQLTSLGSQSPNLEEPSIPRERPHSRSHVRIPAGPG
jgi:hypothetical protein